MLVIFFFLPSTDPEFGNPPHLLNFKAAMGKWHVIIKWHCSFGQIGFWQIAFGVLD